MLPKTFTTATIHITPKILTRNADIDEFKGALWAFRSGKSARSALGGDRRKHQLVNLDIHTFTSRDKQEVAGYIEVMEIIFGS